MVNLPRADDVQLQVEKARRELATTNELIAQIKTEIRTLEARRKEIRAEIDQDTAEVRQQRERELKELEHRSKEALQPLTAERQAILLDITRSRRDQQDLEMAVLGVRTELDAVRAQVGQANREVEAAEKEKLNLETHRSSLSAQITTLAGRIAPLKDTLVDLQDQVAGTEKRLEDANWELTSAQADMLAKKTALEREVTELAHKRRDLASNLNVEMKQYETTRTALVEWEEKLNKRDKILRAREYKVAIDEDKIAQNAGLLNL